MTLGMMSNITALTLSIDTANDALKGLIDVLQDALLTKTTDIEKQDIVNTIRQIENTGPLSGKGFFSITRGTITGMLSISITYIIIIVQFKLSVITTPSLYNSTSTV